MVAGALLVVAAGFITVDVAGVSLILLKAVGAFVAFHGLSGLRTVWQQRLRQKGCALVLRLLCAIVGLVLAAATTTDSDFLRMAVAVFLGLDGLTRIPVIGLVRFEEWPEAVGMVALELVLALILATAWFIPADRHVALLFGLVAATAGATLMRFALFLRTTPAGRSIHASPLFSDRGWNQSAVARRQPAETKSHGHGRMRVWIWTPVSATEERIPVPFIDYYLMAFDRRGKPSAGHSAIEVSPDLYISLWPDKEIPAKLHHFPNLFFAGETNDKPGMFPPSYAWECEDWMPADRHVDFQRFNYPALSAYWENFRASPRYNAGDRNCAITVAGALETAMEGTLATDRPWWRLVSLLLSPAIIQAAFLRSRARHMCWTPGMVHDYAQAFRCLVDGEARGGIERNEAQNDEAPIRSRPSVGRVA
ncbi:hypothetical protein [Rhizobium glycinendophyticum]|uniref:Protease n=1 Tax=Rhizobium glycinendophyticum TaxID=2589807 RepID=A0A504UB93_9HYPH|nr:hypothetical protein [Rhizobium glycinendophyticum]TPP10560.1 hypothetical protein FJQ55_06860 [Rhizobium glycinendophyticum]